VNGDCPICGGGIPNDLLRGEYPGALSRVDNLTEICSDCGVSEALAAYQPKFATWNLQQCRKCDRVFDLNVRAEADLFFQGHGCPRNSEEER
jgi:hypothetical protein